MSETYVSLDLETTGLDPQSDEVIEIGAVKFQGNDILETFHTLVKPYRSLPYRIQVLTGIAQSDVDAAPPLAVVLGDLVSFLGDYPIVGQSVAFDLSFLLEKGVSLPNPIYDTFELATILLPTLSEYGLSAVAERLGIHAPLRHRALPDAMVAKEAFTALLDKAYELDIPIIAEIVRLTGATDWPLARLFRRIEEEKVSDASSKVIEFNSEEVDFNVLDKEQKEGEEGKKLTPVPSRKPLDLERLTGMLGTEGLMAQVIPGFEHRPEQVEMMQAVAEALNNSQHLIVEAGTGTGKSIAYLLPAIFFALGNNVPIVISTNTINLQEQLMGKDIPDLIKALGGHFEGLRYAQLKGRGNYLCLRRWNLLRRSQALPLDEVKFLLRTLVWVAQTQSGDRAEIAMRGGETALWNRVCAQGESCLGAQCIYQKRGSCFLYGARRKAEGAHLIIVNHALLLSDIAAGSKVLPNFGHLIIDEAHHLEEEATGQWGFEVAERDLSGYLNRLSERVEGDLRGLVFELGAHFRGSTHSPSSVKEIEELAQGVHNMVEGCRDRVLAFFDAFWRFLEAHAEDQREYERRLRLTGAVRAQPGWSRVALAWENLSLALQNIEAGLSRLYSMLEPLPDANILDYENLMIELSSLLHRSGELRHEINAAIASPEEDNIYWASLRNTLSLCAAPLHVGAILEDCLFSQKECILLTSATLSTEGNFEYIKERLGLTEARELLLGSSFDYMNSAMVYIPEDIPEPGQPGYQQAVEQALIDLCRASKGRAMALFTSYAALRASYGAIWAPLQGEGILVLGQGIDGAPRQLLQTFKTYPRAFLLGTSSFWEGIDVVGEALSVLVMARLPFSVPNDPVFAARSELFEDPFNEYAIPQSVLRFKQGFGRLIRSKSDRGVILVLDRRIRTKFYGAAFLGSLPL
ncbi:MAG: helicase C-terminal domain-containing protein, partial [Dehalococcoidia bacterium]